jgi:hypothetical protein
MEEDTTRHSTHTKYKCKHNHGDARVFFLHQWNKSLPPSGLELEEKDADFEFDSDFSSSSPFNARFGVLAKWDSQSILKC